MVEVTLMEKFSHLLKVCGTFNHRNKCKACQEHLLLLVGGGAKEEQQRLNLSGTLCRPSIRHITIFHRFFFFFCFIQISLLAVFSKPSGLLQILSQYIYI